MSDNINVVVKVRPLIPREVEEKCGYRWRVKNNTLIQLDENGRQTDTCFTFDRVYDKDTKTREVYDNVAKPIVEAALNGFNGTIFAYGQTSSGKTYTMSGTDKSPGIITLAVLNIFNNIKNVPDRDFLVRVSYIEIYNETLKDLLNIDKKNIKIHETFEGGVKVDATEKVTSSPEEVLEAMKVGEANRQTGATNMNEESSRSHSIFQITIESREHVEDGDEGGCVNVSQLNLVDLAGSERSGQTGATGIRFKEGTHINKSLSCLALVIKQLSEDPNRYVNFRDSKLTRILQNSLGGNAKTSIICAVTPATVEETASTLQFANRAKAIKNKPEVNAVATDATMIQSLTKQLSRLQSELATKRNLLQTKQTYEQELEKKIAGLRKVILNGFGQRSSRLGTRSKLQPPRRMTISTLHNIEEDPAPAVAKFCTPSLKYNPMSVSAERLSQPAQRLSQLPVVPEESRALTPPPNPRNVVVDGEIIELDSDDDDPSEIQACSPYHKCYSSSKTPPCVLRKTAKQAERQLKDIVELTEREKIYQPTVVELLEKQEQNTALINKLQEEIEALLEKSNEKDSKIDDLKTQIAKTEQEVKNITALKSELETKCRDYEARLTDSEVSYETLVKKSKAREQDLLSLLEEHKVKKAEEIGKLSKKLEKSLNFMDMSKDISLVNSDNESSINHPNENDPSAQVQELVKDMQSQLTNKNEIIIALEASISDQKLQIESLETSSQKLQGMVDDINNKLSSIETEKSFLISTIDSLNSTIENQKQHLESVNKDVKSYSDTIQELQIKLNKKDEILNSRNNDTLLENMIANEQQFIANNDNIKNIIHSFKIALDKRNKEIDVLQIATKENSELLADNTALKKQIEVKENQITVLLEEAERLRDELKENIAVMSKLVQIEQDLTEQLNTVQKENEELQKRNTESEIRITYLNNINSENFIKIEKLQLENEELARLVAEKEANEQTLSDVNQDLLNQIKCITDNINDLENVKCDLTNIASEREKETQEHVGRAQAILQKFYNVLQRLNCNTEYTPDTMQNLKTVLNILHAKVDNIDAAIIRIAEERDQKNQEIHKLKNKLSSETDQNNTKLVEKLNIEFVIQTENFLRQITELTDELNKTRTELENHNQFNMDMEIKLNDASKSNENLRIDILSKEQSISYLKDQLATALKETETSRQTQDSEIELLTNNLLKVKETLENVILEKDSQIALLEEKLSDVTLSIEDKYTEVTAALKDTIANRDNLLISIFKKASKLTLDCDIDTVMQYETSDNVYEQVILILDRIANHIMLLRTENDTDSCETKKLLTIANQEIENLSSKNIKLNTEFEEITNKNKKLLSEIEKINNLNKELLGASELLEELKMELKMKSEEIKTLEDKAVEWKDQFKEYEIAMELKMEDIISENARLKNLQDNETNKFIDLSDHEFSCSKSRPSLEENFDMRLPQKLQTICFYKMMNTLQSNISDITSTTTLSSTSVPISNVKTQTENCQCSYLTSKLNKAQEENFELLKLIEDFDTTNKFLLNEREEVRKEIQLLIAPANELQKKITNHRTNLSTLTATTYAENKLLNSQLKVLKHHHTRSINLCQRDLPVFKSQLKDLMTILNESSFVSDRQNTSFKRYSLPDFLERNTSVSTFKNESVLDGDLLMMDTNMTLTTLADNTLVGHEQTCLEITQTNFDNEICQENYLSKSIDPCLMSQIEILTSDNLKLLERLEAVKEENSKLKEQMHISDPNLITQIESISNENFELLEQLEAIKIENDTLKEEIKKNHVLQYTSFRDAEISPIKMNDYHSNISQPFNKDDVCKKCNELQTAKEKLVQALEETRAQKDDFKQKFDNLSLEVPLIDALRRKLTNLEKDHQNKVEDISKLNSRLEKNNLLLKELQEENDTLSTQVIDNISEADDLKVKLNRLKEENTKLSEKCDHLELRAKELCPDCTMKDELILTLQSNKADHSKLNRSLSDSDSSSRLNKICTLQSELHASKEDCKKITEEVATIKNQLDRSNISIGQAMDLDESIGEPNIFTFTKDLVPEASNKPKTELLADAYAVDKLDCVNFYIEKTGAGKENLDSEGKIIEVMKMLYNNLLAKHANEVENLLNQLKGFEESRTELQSQLSSANLEHSKLTKKLEESNNNIKIVQNVLSKIKDNTNIIHQEMSNIEDSEKHSKFVILFKEKLLKVIDTDLGMSLGNMFDVLIDCVLRKHQRDLTGMSEQYTTLQSHMDNVVSQLNIATENLELTKSQLTVKENDFNLLKAQKERIFEISNAVTLDIIKKEKELSEILAIGCKKLEDLNILVPSNTDSAISVEKNIQFLFERLMLRKHSEADADNEIQKLNIELKNLRTCLEEKEKTINILNNKLSETENNFDSQKSLNEDLTKLYENKINENNVHVNIIRKISEEIETLKATVMEKDNCIQTLEQQIVKETEAIATVTNLECLKQEYDSLKSVNEMIVKEKDVYAAELEKAQTIISNHKSELERMTADILVLRESVNDHVSVIESLTLEAKKLMEQNVQLKKQLEERDRDCSRLEMNIKTHEKTAQIQSKMIVRLQNQKEENDKLASEKSKELEDLTEKYSSLQNECDILKENLKNAREEIDSLAMKKEGLEPCGAAGAAGGAGGARRGSLEAARRRRQSLHDSRRSFQHLDCDDHDKIEAVFDSRSKPDDLFAGADEDGSDRSTPIRLSRGRDSLIGRHDQSDKDEETSRPSSVTESRRRRRSAHDRLRAARPTISPHDSPTKLDELNNAKPDILGGNSTESDIRHLRDRVSRLQQELEELRERYREVDEECDTCAQYLRERDDQCRSLYKEKVALEQQVAVLLEKLKSSQNQSRAENKPSIAHASVNTDADWANLHSVVVDRMSFDAEVEKNKKLSRTIEELRCNKQELKNTLAKMQKALEKNSGYRESKELEATKAELAACRQELEDLRARYRELDEECDTCAQYLRERDEQCRQLVEARRALEGKLKALQEECGAGAAGGAAGAARRKRRSLHDTLRSPLHGLDAHTEISDDFLSNQVERDESSAGGGGAQAHVLELKRVKIALEQVSKEKAALESQLLSASTQIATPMFVATGSAIVQNQQITDVMKENQKLKKINAKLITICKKRGKSVDRANEEPSDLA